MTKREFIEMLEATDAPDDAPVIVSYPTLRLKLDDPINGTGVVADVRDSHAGPGVFVICEQL